MAVLLRERSSTPRHTTPPPCAETRQRRLIGFSVCSSRVRTAKPRPAHVLSSTSRIIVIRYTTGVVRVVIISVSFPRTHARRRRTIRRPLRRPRTIRSRAVGRPPAVERTCEYGSRSSKNKKNKQKIKKKKKNPDAAIVDGRGDHARARNSAFAVRDDALENVLSPRPSRAPVRRRRHRLSSSIIIISRARGSLVGLWFRSLRLACDDDDTSSALATIHNAAAAAASVETL